MYLTNQLGGTRCWPQQYWWHRCLYNKWLALIYVSKKLNSKIRNDIKIYKPKELESTFIEITNPRKKITLIGCIYKHPCMSVDEFNDIYLTPLLKKITFENKNIFLTGDFNINLLNTETDEPTLVMKVG